MDSEQIRHLLRSEFPQAEIDVSSEDNVHFTAKVVDDGFHAKSRLQRHRMVHEAIGSQLGREIHALTLSLKTREEAGGPG